MTIAVSCDMIIAGQNASFGYPEIDVGLIPALHFVQLPRLVGKHQAFGPLFLGEPFDAPTAFRMGLDDRFHETCVMELMVWLRIPRLRLAKRGARSWQDGGG
jgi:enoyl-CoA hydratase/carnithine racemase